MEIVDALETLHISARRLKFFRVDIDHVPKILSWYFTTDGDVYFGVFFEVSSQQDKSTYFLAPKCSTQNAQKTRERRSRIG
jgi:hypothetical protein